MQRSPLFPPSIPTPPTPQPFPPLDVHSNIHFSFCFPPYLRHLAALGSDGAVARRQVKLESICAQRTIGAWRFTAKKKKKADSDFVYSHGTPWLCPTFISCAEKKNSAQTLAWSFEKAPFTHNETICARVCRCKRWRRTLCSRISVHARLFCRCACLCIC